jgi:hypothetical protein
MLYILMYKDYFSFEVSSVAKCYNFFSTYIKSGLNKSVCPWQFFQPSITFLGAYSREEHLT